MRVKRETPIEVNQKLLHFLLQAIFEAEIQKNGDVWCTSSLDLTPLAMISALKYSQHNIKDDPKRRCQEMSRLESQIGWESFGNYLEFSF